MPAYLIARVQITDPLQYSEYTKVTPGIIAHYGGRFLVRGGECVSLEGPPETGRVVVVEFPSLDAATAFYRSAEYGAAKLLREGAAGAQFIAVDGVAVQA